MIYFKGCAKCHVDMVPDEDSYLIFFKCLQHGRHVDLGVQEPGLTIDTGLEAAGLAA